MIRTGSSGLNLGGVMMGGILFFFGLDLYDTPYINLFFFPVHHDSTKSNPHGKKKSSSLIYKSFF